MDVKITKPERPRPPLAAIKPAGAPGPSVTIHRVWRWIAAAALLAATAYILAPPYQFVPMPHMRALVRVNRWTGSMYLCTPTNNQLVCRRPIKDP